MRTPLVALALAISAAGCSTPGFVAEFAAAVRELPASGRVVVEYHKGKPTRYAVSIDPATVPAVARRTADEIVQPGGKTVFTLREWGAAGNGYRFVKLYGEWGPSRSVLVNADGTVLERTHDIDLDQSPPAARSKVQSIAKGLVASVEVIQGKLRSPDLYRFSVMTSAGQQIIITTEDGTIVAQGREVQATIFSGR